MSNVLENATRAAPELPCVEELRPAPDPRAAFLRFSSLPHCIFFDSSRRHLELGRYSFLSADPFEFLRLPADGSAALAELQQRWEPFTAATVAGLPTFQGGAAGLLSYELAHSLERLPRPRFNEFNMPQLAVGLYDAVICWDHATGCCYLVSHGFPEMEPAAKHRRAAERLEQFKQQLARPPFDHPSQGVPSNGIAEPIPRDALAPQFATGYTSLTSDFSAYMYRDAVQRVIDYIHAGDVFQVNLSQRLLHPAEDDPVSLYLRLRERNRATFGGYFDLGDYQILSTSPERFVSVAQRIVETRPIKGTRPRTGRPEADLYAAEDLEASEKDRAENVMIVDLLRNDLSKVCTPHSVRVDKLCGLEIYERVLHLVSVIAGRMRRGLSPIDLLRAVFPGGSITGAPKIRAMEIIAELEPTARGAYCGSLGYLGFDGSLDTNILIRTVTAGRGWWQIPVGGGIVAQSSPQSEYEETWHKAAGMLDALRNS